MGWTHRCNWGCYLAAAAGLLMMLGCQSKPVGMTRTADGSYVVVQQDSVLGMKTGKPHYTDNGKRVEIDDTIRLPSGSGDSSR
jgi:hypothetical protein